MGYQSNNEGDFEKLLRALKELTRMFGSTNDILEAFGLANMPSAQRYGILFGFLVFIVTISSVVALLIFGGSFHRIREQAVTGESTIKSATETRKERSLLLEQLLEGRQRMVQNYEPGIRTKDSTSLTKMLLNVAPSYIPKEEEIDLHDLYSNDEIPIDSKQVEQLLPTLYKENYTDAYRKCLDKPGGPVLPGRPEARFECYARAYAGCGPFTTKAYRRSYGRIYEALCCKNHLMNDKYNKLFQERPYDIVGRHVRLEPLDATRHVEDLYLLLSGASAFENNPYDPNEVWGFLEDGPFESVEEMSHSSVFNRKLNDGSFALIHGVTDQVIGMVHLCNDDPSNLSVQLEPPIMTPNSSGTQLQLESCFLLLDRLFAYGYRRIQTLVDTQDIDRKKLCLRLGFAFEGIMYKHMVVKEASRDSLVYALLNSDWRNSVRAALFKKLYGDAAYRADAANEKYEAELEDQRQRKAAKDAADEAVASTGHAKKLA